MRLLKVSSLGSADARVTDDVPSPAYEAPSFDPPIFGPRIGAYLLPITKIASAAPESVTSLEGDFTLGEAVACRSFTALDPVSIPVPAALMDAVKRAGSILLIGHIHPDGDCVGSTLALGRALRLIGKRIDVCVDDELSGQLRNVDDAKQVRRARDLGGRKWDLAIVMDTMVPVRLGGAIDLLPHASEVAVVDHHEGQVDAAALGIDGQPFHTWIEPAYPAAALMSAGMIRRFESQFSSRLTGAVYEPALAGFATDVRFGELPGFDREYFRYFKHMLSKTSSTVASLEARLSVQPPAKVAALIRDADVDLPDKLQARLLELRGAGATLRAMSYLDDPPLTVLICSTSYLDLLVDVGRLEVPEFNRLDVEIALKDLRDRHLKQSGGTSAVLFEGSDRTIVSLRSASGDAALRIATSFGGGGHKMSAAARVMDMTADQVVAHIRGMDS